MIDTLKFHEKNPEKHPMYPDEWKKFWNRRYKELQAEGKNPAKHDFKPEWIQYWNRRMREMYDEELKSKKDECRVRLGLPEECEAPPRGGQSAQSRKRKSGSGGAGDGDRGDDVIVLSPTSSGKDEKQSRKDVTVADIKNTWKALTGSDIKESGSMQAGQRSPSPWEESEGPKNISRSDSPSFNSGGKWWPKGRGNSGRGRGGRSSGMGPHRGGIYEPNDGPRGVVHALRLLTALENQLGSLGPQINTLLAKALTLEKVAFDSSEQLLADPTHTALFETAREKLKGQLFAGIVERQMVMATRSAIESVNCLLAKAEKFLPASVATTAAASATTLSIAAMSSAILGVPSLISPSTLLSSVSTSIPVSEPVVVPGIGAVDKVAIAQQIAEALVAQGRTDVSQEELETLINAVVGMAQASASSQEPISAAAYARQQREQEQQQQIQQQVLQSHVPIQPAQLPGALSVDTTHGTEPNKPSTHPSGGESPFTQLLSSVSRSAGTTRTPSTGPSALQILQSAYNDSAKISGSGVTGSHKGGPFSGRADSMDDLSEEDLKTLLQNFKELPSEEQYGLISYLKKVEAKEPARVERLRQFVNVGQLVKSPKKEPQIMRKTPTGRSDSSFENKISDGNFLRGSNSNNDRLSPFSLREGGINPSGDSVAGRNESERNTKVKMDDSDDEDYSFEDIYAAASKKVKEREKAIAEETAKLEREEEKKKKKAAEDPRLLLKETKAIIANLMGQLPAKFIQKQSPLKESPKTPRKTEAASVSESAPTNFTGSSVKQPMFDLAALQQPPVQESIHSDMSSMNQHINMDMNNSNMDMNSSQYYSNYSDTSGNYGGQYQNQSQYTNQGYTMEGYPSQGGYGGSNYQDGGYYSSQQQPQQQQQPQPQQQPQMPPQQSQQLAPPPQNFGPHSHPHHHHHHHHHNPQQQQQHQQHQPQQHQPQQHQPQQHQPQQHQPQQHHQQQQHQQQQHQQQQPQQQYPQQGYGGPDGGYTDQNMMNSGYQQQTYQPGPQNYPTGYGQYSGQQGYY